MLTARRAVRYNALARRLADILPMLADYMGEHVKRIMHQVNHVIPAYIKTALASPDGGRVFNEILNSPPCLRRRRACIVSRARGSSFLLLEQKPLRSVSRHNGQVKFAQLTQHRPSSLS